MVQIVDESSVNESTGWSKYHTIKPTSRVKTLRQRYLNTKNKVTIDIARVRTECARFVDLDKGVQDSIIARTEHKL